MKRVKSSLLVQIIGIVWMNYRLMKPNWLIGLLILSWSANQEPDLVGYTIYSKASTDSVFKRISSVHKQTSVKLIVDGRRNWTFYVTARTKTQESAPSNHVVVLRGY